MPQLDGLPRGGGGGQEQGIRGIERRTVDAKRIVDFHFRVALVFGD